MNDVIVLENILDDDGFQIVHLMSNKELNADVLKTYYAPDDAPFEVTKEAGVYHLRAKWMMCGPVVVQAEGWPIPKRLLVWNLSLAGSVKAALYEANKKYEDLFLERAEYAFIRKLPRGVENGTPIPLAGTSPKYPPSAKSVEYLGEEVLLLFEAEWMVRKCVAVGFNYQ